MDSILAIIPVHNRRETTLSILGNLARLNRINFRLDILIIDDGSIDGTAEAISERFPETKIIKGDGNLWWGGSINVGLRYALCKGYDYAYTLNDDIKLYKDTLVELHREAARSKDTIFGSTIIDNSGQVLAAGYEFSSLQRKLRNPRKAKSIDVIGQKPIPCAALSTQSVLIPKVVLQRGLFVDDVHFPHNFSDIDYFDRIRRAGFLLSIVPSSVIQAEESSSNYHRFILDNRILDILRSFGSIKYAHNIRTQWSMARRGVNLPLAIIRFLGNMAPYAFWFVLRMVLPYSRLMELFKAKGMISLGRYDKRKMISKVLFVGDGGQSQCLDNLLATQEVSIDYKVRRLSIQLGLLRRHLGYMLLAVLAVLKRKRYSVVFIWQQYIAIYYWIFSLFYPFNTRPTMVYYIIFKSCRSGLLTFAKRMLMLRMINSRNVCKVFFMSPSDELYGLSPKEKKSVLNKLYMHSEYIEARIQESRAEYIFSGGASNRDYAVLKRLAMAMPQERFIMACLPKTAAELSPLPSNLQAYTNAYGDDFEDLILRAKAVVLPIEDPNVMSGQIVCLRAMQAGKPIFITANNFLKDWLGDLKCLDFIFTYQDLNSLLSMLAGYDSETIYAMGTKARDHYKKNYSEASFYGRIADEITTAIAYFAQSG